jgi:plasmid stabilization system protein ParE
MASSVAKTLQSPSPIPEMSRRLEWSPGALHDLQRLHRFLQPKNPRAADRAIATIRVHLETLKVFPDAGRLAEDSEIDHRELVIPFSTGGYVASYRFDDLLVHIIDVRHQREAGH